MSLADPAIARLRSSFGGAVIAPDDADYDSARRAWSAQYDRRPAIVVRPVDAADVTAAMRFAREQDLVVSVRGGGHSISGHSTSEGGMLLDLSALRGVSVDPGARIARVAGGALLAELDRATLAHGLVCPSGTVGHTGVAGLTLGGGVGRLQRPFGLTLDNLVAAELVTADGRHVRTSADEHPDLFWALRGAGPNFGVVTAFEFRLHPFGPTLTRGVRIFRGSDAEAVWQAYRALLGSAPRELGLNFVIARAEEDDTYPEDARGGPIAVVAYNHPGSEADAAAALAPLAAAAEPIMENGGTAPYLDVQAMYDSDYEAGQRYYSIGGFANDLPPAVVRALVERAADAAGEAGFSATGQGGAIADLDEAATAFTGRSAVLRVTADSTWTDPSGDDDAIAWCRAAMAVVEPELVPGRYVNEVFEDGTDPAAIYGAQKAARLAAIKRAWDPDNVFRMNHNIPPAEPGGTAEPAGA
jgi:FAD/FMN-containing dehydrogenase